MSTTPEQLRLFKKEMTEMEENQTSATKCSHVDTTIIFSFFTIKSQMFEQNINQLLI